MRASNHALITKMDTPEVVLAQASSGSQMTSDDLMTMTCVTTLLTKSRDYWSRCAHTHYSSMRGCCWPYRNLTARKRHHGSIPVRTQTCHVKQWPTLDSTSSCVWDLLFYGYFLVTNSQLFFGIVSCSDHGYPAWYTLSTVGPFQFFLNWQSFYLLRNRGLEIMNEQSWLFFKRTIYKHIYYFWVIACCKLNKQMRGGI